MTNLVSFSHLNHTKSNGWQELNPGASCFSRPPNVIEQISSLFF